MTYNADDYDWHKPEDVVLVHLADSSETIAYGVPKPVVLKFATGDRPLPRPPHTDHRDGPCLGCEWIALNRKVQDRG